MNPLTVFDFTDIASGDGHTTTPRNLDTGINMRHEEEELPYTADSTGKPVLPTVANTGPDFKKEGVPDALTYNHLDELLKNLDADGKKKKDDSKSPIEEEDVTTVTSQDVKKEDNMTSQDARKDDNKEIEQTPEVTFDDTHKDTHTTTQKPQIIHVHHNNDDLIRRMDQQHQVHIIVIIIVGLTCTFLTVGLLGFFYLRRKMVKCVGCMAGCLSSLTYCCYRCYGKLSWLEDSQRSQQIYSEQKRYISEAQRRQGSRLSLSQRRVSERRTFVQMTETASLLNQPLQQIEPAGAVGGDTGASPTYDHVNPSLTPEIEVRSVESVHEIEDSHSPCCSRSCFSCFGSCHNCTRRNSEEVGQTVRNISSPVLQDTTATGAVHRAEPLDLSRLGMADLGDERKPPLGPKPSNSEFYMRSTPAMSRRESSDPSLDIHTPFTVGSVAGSVNQSNTASSLGRPQRGAIRMNAELIHRQDSEREVDMLRKGLSMSSITHSTLSQSEIFRRKRDRLVDDSPTNDPPASSPPMTRNSAAKKSVKELRAHFDGSGTANVGNQSTPPSQARGESTGAVHKICPRPQRGQSRGQLNRIPEIQAEIQVHNAPDQRTDGPNAVPTPPPLPKRPAPSKPSRQY